MKDPKYTCSGCGRAIPCRHCPDGTPPMEKLDNQDKEDFNSILDAIVQNAIKIRKEINET